MGSGVWVYEVLSTICNTTSAFCLFFFLYADDMTMRPYESKGKKKKRKKETLSDKLTQERLTIVFVVVLIVIVAWVFFVIIW